MPEMSLKMPQVAIIAPIVDDVAATKLRRAATALLVLSLITAKSVIGPLAGAIAALSVLLISTEELPKKAGRIKFLAAVAACLAFFEAASMSVALVGGLPSHMAEVVEVKCNHIPACTFEWVQSQATLFRTKTGFAEDYHSHDHHSHDHDKGHEDHHYHQEGPVVESFDGVVSFKNTPRAAATPEPLVKMSGTQLTHGIEPVQLEEQVNDQAYFCRRAGRIANRLGEVFIVLTFTIKALLFYSGVVVAKRAALLQVTYIGAMPSA